jgi:Zn-dependent oligopeptidase
MVPADIHKRYFVLVLCSFARHFKTGEPLPEDTIIQLCQTKKMFSASVSIVRFYDTAGSMVLSSHVLFQSIAPVKIQDDIVC